MQLEIRDVNETPAWSNGLKAIKGRYTYFRYFSLSTNTRTELSRSSTRTGGKDQKHPNKILI